MEKNTRRGRPAKTDKYECVPGYTANQSRVIRGEVEHANVTGRLAQELLKRATKLNDKAVMELASRLVSASHERAIIHNREQVRKRIYNLKHGQIVWKQPKSNEYTGHQRQVVRGEIPIDTVHTNELISIHLKAKNLGDIELSERILSIIIDRRNESIEHIKEHLQKHLRKISLDYDEDDPEVYMKRDHLSPIEIGVLKSVVDLDQCSADHLKHILDVCEKQHDEHNAELARMLLNIKEHPESIYVTQDPETAIDMIEIMFGKPIRRPETWFQDKKHPL